MGAAQIQRQLINLESGNTNHGQICMHVFAVCCLFFSFAILICGVKYSPLAEFANWNLERMIPVLEQCLCTLLPENSEFVYLNMFLFVLMF